MPEFVGFPKIPRLRRPWTVTEKIDGTNAQVYIVDKLSVPTLGPVIAEVGDFFVYAGSRNRWITPKDDNYGFAKWVNEHALDLVDGLGPGRHFGEWWGSGIQSGYGLQNGEKHWSLFNVKKWYMNPDLPSCCRVVPVLVAEEDNFDDPIAATEEGLYLLEKHGSFAAPGFDRPEGVVAYQPQSGILYKRTALKDDQPKGVNA